MCAGRSAAAPQPPGQAAGPRCASVPHTASLSPGGRHNQEQKLNNPPKLAPQGPMVPEPSKLLGSCYIRSVAVTPAPVKDLQRAQNLESNDKGVRQTSKIKVLSIWTYDHRAAL